MVARAGGQRVRAQVPGASGQRRPQPGPGAPRDAHGGRGGLTGEHPSDVRGSLHTLGKHLQDIFLTRMVRSTVSKYSFSDTT